jgi:hypothetical protein
MPNPRGYNQYKHRGGAGGRASAAKSSSPWAAPSAASRISASGPHSPPGMRAAQQRASSRKIKQIKSGSGSNAAKAKKISAELQRSGVTVSNHASHEAFVKAQLDRQKARKRRR